MARLDGGIFSRPSGSTAGITFGAARTRQGKVATARQKVSPTNPNTPAQQTQRGKFGKAQHVTRLWGPSIYQSGFNRAVSQLPGFQSLQSILTLAIDDNLIATPPPETRLGTIPTPSSLTVDPGSSPGWVNVQWGSTGSGQDDNDQIQVVYMLKDLSGSSGDDSGGKGGYAERVDGSIIIQDMLPATDYIVGVYTIGQGSNAGKRGNCQWFEVTSGS